MVTTEPIPPVAFVLVGFVALIVAVPLWIFLKAIASIKIKLPKKRKREQRGFDLLPPHSHP